ncbi:unnamed protein product [Polarella glacialis]|uniref:Uncharacterized protein n=1 Tax=Polarella glacialis TaxID=89957 RepID=A0A813LQF2_POLGL|nr:unnamed protein product [Polarella glacialis]
MRQSMEASTFENALLGVKQEILARAALRAQAEWPALELASARALIAAVDSCEAEWKRGREQISGDGAASTRPEDLCSVLDGLLSAFSGLQEAQKTARASESGMCSADLDIQARASTVRPLVDALLDSAIEVHSIMLHKDADGPRSAALASKLRELLGKPSAREALATIRVEVPSHDLFEGIGQQSQEPGRGSSATADSSKDNQAAPADAAEESGKAAAGAPDALLMTVPGEMLPGTASMADGDCDSSSRLWQAVHVGDEATLRALVERQLCNGKMRDASGHSVLWHLIAFGHLGIAEYIMDAFPPGSSKGVEVDEVHERRGDTLLHLLCGGKSFSKEAATLFKRVTAVAPDALLPRPP